MFIISINQLLLSFDLTINCLHHASRVIWYGTNNTESNTTGTARTISKTNDKANVLNQSKSVSLMYDCIVDIKQNKSPSTILKSTNQVCINYT
jgi:hypothetical protein